MLDPNKVKIGIAPIAWTEDDMPEMGAENSFLQTISEIALTGYVGTEIGCQYPRDPAILNKEFGRRGISAITAWISTYLNEQPLWWNERAFVDHMNFLKSIGCDGHQHLGPVLLHPAPVEHPACKQEGAQ